MNITTLQKKPTDLAKASVKSTSSRLSPAPSGGSSRSSPASTTSNINSSQQKSSGGWDAEDTGWEDDSWGDSTTKHKSVTMQSKQKVTQKQSSGNSDGWDDSGGGWEDSGWGSLSGM